jgi:hypothetical protein
MQRPAEGKVKKQPTRLSWLLMFEGVAKLQAGRSSSLGNEEGKEPRQHNLEPPLQPDDLLRQELRAGITVAADEALAFHPRILVHHISFLTLLSSTFRGLPLSFQGYTRYSAEGNLYKR